jgi:HEPN domain-containing protein
MRSHDDPDRRLRELLRHADAMAAAADRIRPEPGHDPAPYLLLRALATELTLKALLLTVKGRYPRVHSLRALLGDLPEDARGRLDALHRGYYRAHRPEADDDEADAALAWIADAAGDLFQAARYPPDHDLREAPDPEPLRRVARGLLTRLVDAGA